MYLYAHVQKSVCVCVWYLCMHACVHVCVCVCVCACVCEFVCACLPVPYQQTHTHACMEVVTLDQPPIKEYFMKTILNVNFVTFYLCFK